MDIASSLYHDLLVCSTDFGAYNLIAARTFGYINLEELTGLCANPGAKVRAHFGSAGAPSVKIL